MNSLQQLNSYSSETLSYTDARPQQIIYDLFETTSPLLSVVEGGNISAAVGKNIVDIVGTTSNVVYRIDLTDQYDVNLYWSNVPTGVVTSNLSGVYTASNITTVAQWDAIKSPTLTMPRDFDGLFFIDSNVSLYVDGNLVSGNSRSWTTTVTVSDLSEMTTPLTTTIYSLNTQNTVTNPPQITNVENASNVEQYTMSISSDATLAFGNLNTAGTQGGVSTWYPGNLTLRLTGNRGQVNSHLATLKYFSSNTSTSPWYLTYTLTNPLSSKVTTRNQFFAQNTVTNLTTPPPYYYYRNVINYVYTAPTIIDTTPGGSEVPYTMIVQSVPVTVSNLQVFGSNIGGDAIWDNTDKTLTITGNGIQVNSLISNLAVTPTFGANTTFNMNYLLFTPDGDSSVQNQLFLANNTVVTGNVEPNVAPPVTSVITAEVLEPRHYLNNQPLPIFTGNMFSYTGNISGTNTYSWSFQSALGRFTQGNENPLTPPIPPTWDTQRFIQPGEIFTHSEIRTDSAPFFDYYIDADSPTSPLYFWPSRDTDQSGYMTFKFYRNSQLEFTQDIALVGVTRANAIPGSGITNCEYINSPEDQMAWRHNDPLRLGSIAPFLYLTANIVLVPGGGAGGGNSSVPGGGGAAGVPVTVSNIKFDTSGYCLDALDWTIGAGGAGGVWRNAQGAPGGNTTAIINGTTYTAVGGQGGYRIQSGGFGGNNTVYIGGLVSGGGGAGAGGNADVTNGGPGYYSPLANIKFTSYVEDFWVGSGGAGPTGNANVKYGGGANVTAGPIGGIGGGGLGGNSGASGGVFAEWFEV